ncbi:hypothetical protein C2869_04185 [Saccharobesus litoralis]|uniref:Sortilin N-terminal domain-containing protein n=1 Tax=Saccharobesus litoralis TaxID=2172099 RepID=A0A2S0VXI0_9ALTE|nr:sialidase family protein [Saccharobesus litoralis]AWB68914.1 hypothetical protein C2869_04185 [Saccharobesus litoralis]
MNQTLIGLCSAVCIASASLIGCGISPTTTSAVTPENQQAYFDRLRTEKVTSNPNIQWQNIGPGMSGYNEELWTHPTNPNVMFIGPDMHVSYGTWDGANSWHSLQDHDELGQLMKRVLDIEFSRQDPNYAMAIDWNGWVYESSNQGRNWQKTAELAGDHRDFGVDPYDPLAFKKGWYDEQIGKRLGDLAVDPNNDNIWYIGAGDFWNVKENHRSINKLGGDKLNYADYGYILKTSNKGKTWQKISKGLPSDLDVGKIIVNPTRSQHLLAATNKGLMQSTDGGMSWQFGAQGLPHNLPRDLTEHYDPVTGEYTLYLIEQTHYQAQGKSVSASGGIYTSTDQGKTWHNITGNLWLDLTQINYPAEHNRYYRTLANWFEISPKQARKKYSQLPKQILPVFNRIVVNPKNKQEIYVTYNKKHDRTFGPGEVWRTLDGGKHWTVVARHGKYWINNPDQDYWAKRNNPTHANVEFAHVQYEMDTHTEDQGNRLLSINSAGEVFISISQQTHKSSDQGKTWQQIDDFEVEKGSNIWIGRGGSDLPGRFMLLETGIPERRLMASGEHGVWQTEVVENLANKADVPMRQIEGQVNDKGMVSISTLAVHPHNPNIIYILAWRQYHSGKLRRSTDGGKTWQNIASVLEVSSKPSDSNVAGAKKIAKKIQGPKGMKPAQNSLLIDPNQPNNMFFVAELDAFSEIYRAPRREPTKGGYGFMKSTDGGYNWKVSNKGFHQDASLRRIILDPDNSNIIYAAAADKNGGLYKSVDQGESWQRMTIPANIKSVNNVFIDRNNKHMFISAGGFYDGKYEEGGAWRSTDNGKTWQQIFKAPVVLQVESSPVDANILLLTVGNQMRLDRQFLNPGLYLSQDGGQSWNKINNNLSNYDKIIDAKPDPYNPNVLWAAGWGSGWNVAYINKTKDSTWLPVKR